MEKTIDKARLIINENEKVIAHILHDVKSPLYSIKIGLQNKLDNELNRDIFETTLDIIKYIENFLVNYSVKEGKFNNISLQTISFMNNMKIDLSDSSNKIPNTAWVQGLVNNYNNTVIIHNSNELNYPLLFVSGNNTSESKENCLYKNNLITINPGTQTINGINISISNTLTCKDATINNNLIVKNKADFTSTVTLNAISQIKTDNIPANDSTYKIPNTKWVKALVDNNKGIKLNPSSNTNQFPIVFYNYLNGSKTDVLCQNSNIWVNPNKGIINATQFTGIAHRAKWGDLAQIYQTDKEYQIGTLVCFGGQKQMTVATKKVNAVISSKPSFLMNKDGKGQAIALVGRVPVLVKGKIEKFDYIGISNQPGIGISLGKQYTQNSIAIALENNNIEDKKLVLCCIQLHI